MVLFRFFGERLKFNEKGDQVFAFLVPPPRHSLSSPGPTNLSHEVDWYGSINIRCSIRNFSLCWIGRRLLREPQLPPASLFNFPGPIQNQGEAKSTRLQKTTASSHIQYQQINKLTLFPPLSPTPSSRAASPQLGTNRWPYRFTNAHHGSTNSPSTNV